MTVFHRVALGAACLAAGFGCGAQPTSPPVATPPAHTPAPDTPASPASEIYPIADGPIDCRGGVLRSETVAKGTIGWCEVDGVKHGPYVRRHKKGALKLKVFFLRGQRQGPFASFFKNGKRKARGDYHEGQRVGSWMFWNRAGEHWTGTVLGTQRQGRWTFKDKKGQVRQEGHYVGGNRHGSWTFRGADGRASEGVYDTGRLERCSGECEMLRPSAEIQEAIAALRPASRACYETAHARRKTVSGNVIIQWTIGSDGAGSKAQVKKTTLQHTGVEDCLIAQANGVRLPIPPGGLPVISQRLFKFSPKNTMSDSLSTNGHCRVADLRPTVNPHRAALGDCLRRLGKGAATVELKWTVSADGQLSGHAMTTPNHPELQRCIRAQTVGWRFPGLAGVCSAKYRLTLGK